MRSTSTAAILAGVGALMGCEDPPRAAARVAEAGASTAPAPPAREGCERVGAMEAALRDRSCVVARVGDDAVRAAMRQLAISASADPPEVIAGAAAVVTVTIRNTGPSEATVFLEARQRLPGPRTDWSRVAGVPEPAGTGPEAPHLFFPMTTTDAWDHDVDAAPTIPNSAERDPPPPTTLAIRLRPGGALTHGSPWWAYRIPAPLPIVKDDAGRRRYVPKTSAVNLSPGEYTVTVDVPLFGLGKEERKASARIRVARAPLPDGDVRR